MLGNCRGKLDDFVSTPVGQRFFPELPVDLLASVKSLVSLKLENGVEKGRKKGRRFSQHHQQK